MSSLNKVRLPDGTELNVSEWLHWPLYSVIEINAGDRVDVDAFSYVRGQTVPRTSGAIAARSADDTDTNQVRARKMNQDESLVVFAITYEAIGLTSTTSGSPAASAADAPLVDANDLKRLHRDLFVELLVGANIKKPQVGVPMPWIGQSIGVSQAVSGEASDVRTATGGYPTPKNQRLLNLPVYIGGFGESAKPGNSMTFVLRTRSPAAITDMVQNIRLRWWLDGLRRRPA